MDLAKHLQRIDEAIAELIAFHPRTAEPASIPHQYIGTIIDNTVGLLMTPANSIDRGGRSIQFESDRGWRSLMQSVHRSFFSSIMSAVELGVAHLCKIHNVSVASKQGQKFSEKIDVIQKAVTDAGLDVPELSALAKHFSGYRPVFADYLEAVLAESKLASKSKKQWRAYFRALSIVRNKVSHSDTSLTDTERNDLRGGGCAIMIGEHGELVVNPRMYAQAAHFILQFLDELESALPPKLAPGDARAA